VDKEFLFITLASPKALRILDYKSRGRLFPEWCGVKGDLAE
jgi:hypothetical protein